MNDTLFILAGTAFLSLLAFAVFAFLVAGIHRTPRVPMSQTSGARRGAFARRVITGVRTRAKDDSQ